MENITIKGKYDPRLPIFAFIASAISKEKGFNRSGLDCLIYEAKKKRLWATDGYRLHLAHMDMGQENRAFRVLIKKVNEIVLAEMKKSEIPQTPNISAVICNPDIIAKKEISISERSPEASYVELMRLYQKHYIQQKFFNCLSIFSNNWKVLICNEENAQFFKSKNCLAVMMMIENK